jgi:hypothetical protein
VRVRCDCAIGVGPRALKSIREATNSIVLETKNRDCCAGELQGGDDLLVLFTTPIRLSSRP